MRHIIHQTLIILTAASLVSCASTKVQTKATQTSTTPQQAVKALKEGNARFVAGRSTHRNLVAQAKETKTGQYPIAAILGCMDSRASSELIFDQGIGDIFSTRVAGNVIDGDLLGSLEYATAYAGAKAIIVVGHTRCGAVGGACHNTKLGNLTGLLEKIKPAVRKVKSDPNIEHHGQAFEDRVSAENVKLVVAQIRAQSSVMQKLEHEGKIIITGALYHLDTREVEFFDIK